MQDIKTSVYLKNDKMFNSLLLELYNIKTYVQTHEPKDEQEKHLFYMIEKESHELEESIEILKNKRIDEHNNN